MKSMLVWKCFNFHLVAVIKYHAENQAVFCYCKMKIIRCLASIFEDFRIFNIDWQINLFSRDVSCQTLISKQTGLKSLKSGIFAIYAT